MVEGDQGQQHHPAVTRAAPAPCRPAAPTQKVTHEQNPGPPARASAADVGKAAGSPVRRPPALDRVRPEGLSGPARRGFHGPRHLRTLRGRCRADRGPAQAAGHLQFWCGAGCARSRRGPRTWHRGGLHARCAQRLCGRHGLCPGDGRGTAHQRCRPLRAARRLAQGPVPAGHQGVGQAARHSRHGPHRPGHRAARVGFRHGGALPQPEPAQRRGLRLRAHAEGPGAVG